MRIWQHSFTALIFLIFGATGSFAQSTGSQIQWEITNRFAPFETQFESASDRSSLFDRYKLLPKESFEKWHERLYQGGLASPYQEALAAGDHAKRMHWDQDKNQHAPRILNFVKAEDDPATTIDVKVWVNSAKQCSWSFGGKTQTTTCREPFWIALPLAGASVAVKIDGHHKENFLKPKHSVIVALGDSYGSGEGNPDYPATWKANRPLAANNNFGWLKATGRLQTPPEKIGASIKHWVDDTCHRSFFSHQSLTALKIASENPHTFVSFLHYACTGAEIFDGVLVPQYQAWGQGVYVPYSQLNFAIRDLCFGNAKDYGAVTAKELGDVQIDQFDRRGGKDNKRDIQSNLNPDPKLDKFSKQTAKLRKANGGHFPNSGILTCPNAKMRKPDHVFVSVGGNDIGFGDIVTYFVVPAQWRVGLVGKAVFPQVCPSSDNRVDGEAFPNLRKHCDKLDRTNGYDAGRLTGKGQPWGMEQRYTLLFNILEHRFDVKSSQIVMPQYPDPLRNSASHAPSCAALSSRDYVLPGDEPLVFNPASAWGGLKAAAPDAAIAAIGWNMKKWHFNLTPGEAKLALKEFDAFRVELSKTAQDRGITYVCSTRDAFIGYGWWKGEHLNMPNTKLPPEFGNWHPSQLDPYIFEKDTRAIRTGNDSVLIQPGDKRITGAMHPNLTGHRLIAEQVYGVLSSR